MSDFDLNYPRDMVGYGPNPPHPQWPGKANIAVNFVLNYEEGGENNVLDGDEGSETFLSDIVPAQSFPNRHLSMESIYEYGSRAGLWRVLRMFEQRDIPLTIFGVARALERNPEAVAAFQRLGHEIACHGLRWISYQSVDPEIERAHMKEAVSIITRLFGAPPQGWYTGRDSPRPVSWSSSTAVSPTTRIPTRMICRTGPRWASTINWSSRTPSKPTTCASPPPPVSPTVTSSTPTSATPSTSSTPKARRAPPRCCP